MNPSGGHNDYDKLQRIFLEALKLRDAAKRQAYLDEAWFRLGR